MSYFGVQVFMLSPLSNGDTYIMLYSLLFVYCVCFVLLILLEPFQEFLHSFHVLPTCERVSVGFWVKRGFIVYFVSCSSLDVSCRSASCWLSFPRGHHTPGPAHECIPSEPSPPKGSCTHLTKRLEAVYWPFHSSCNIHHWEKVSFTTWHKLVYLSCFSMPARIHTTETVNSYFCHRDGDDKKNDAVTSAHPCTIRSVVPPPTRVTAFSPLK